VGKLKTLTKEKNRGTGKIVGQTNLCWTGRGNRELIRHRSQNKQGNKKKKGRTVGLRRKSEEARSAR